MLPPIKVSPIQAIPKIATTACIPALNTEPVAALIPSVRVMSRINAAAPNINTSMICAIGIKTVPALVSKWGRKVSIEPNKTIANVAKMKIATERAALR